MGKHTRYIEVDQLNLKAQPTNLPHWAMSDKEKRADSAWAAVWVLAILGPMAFYLIF